MITRKSYKFRLNPTKKQAGVLQKTLDECRWLYNHLLEQRKLFHEELDQSLSKFQQNMFLPLLKEERPSLLLVHSQVLQNVTDRIDKAFKNFFRRCKSGEKPGFPRFRGFDRYDSFCDSQSGFSIEGKELKLSKIGNVRIVQHREIQGKICTCTIRREGGEWYACFSCEVEAIPLPANENSIGIDLGIESFATLSDGQKIENPRFFKKAEADLAKAQRKLSKCEKGTLKRKKRKKVVLRDINRLKTADLIFATKYLEISSKNLNIFA